MRKRVHMLIGILFVLQMPLLLSAQRQHLSLHAHLGMAVPQKENIHSSLSSGFGLTYHFLENLSVKVDFEFWKSTVDEDPDGLYSGEMSVTPFLASLQYHISSGSRFRPYVFMGTGCVFNSFKSEDVITIPEVTISQKVDNGLGLQAGLGAVLELSRSFGIMAEGLLFYRKAGGTTIINDMNRGVSTEDFSVNLSALAFHVGITYFIQ